VIEDDVLRAGVLHPYAAIGPAVRAAVEQQTGCEDPSIAKGWMEEGGGGGTAGAHWEERTFYTEIETGECFDCFNFVAAPLVLSTLLSTLLNLTDSPFFPLRPLIPLLTKLSYSALPLLLSSGMDPGARTALSNLTLAYLQDTGWYDVDMTLGQLFSYGRDKGCDFLTARINELDPESDLYRQIGFCPVVGEYGCAHDFR
jgi:hypothetical protein